MSQHTVWQLMEDIKRTAEPLFPGQRIMVLDYDNRYHIVAASGIWKWLPILGWESIKWPGITELCEIDISGGIWVPFICVYDSDATPAIRQLVKEHPVRISVPVQHFDEVMHDPVLGGPQG